MKTLYLECAMGAAGDMVMAALLELLEPEEQKTFLRQMNSLGLDGVEVTAEPSRKCGILGTRASVLIKGMEECGEDAEPEHSHTHGHIHEHAHEHTHVHDSAENARPHEESHAGHCHTGMADIHRIVDGLPVSLKVKENVLGVYQLIAEAEAHVHGEPVTEIHFHEVGNLDAIADITGVCLLMEKLAPGQVVVSPVHVGSGFVRCAHGLLPVPAPAAARILQGVPAYSGKIRGELCTPTGAAILRYFADSFGSMPEIRVEKIGYGMGKKDFEAANCLRTFLGETIRESGGTNGEIAELQCNVDDMTGEAVGYACGELWNAGALDVFTTAVQMKKERPGIQLTCLCALQEADSFAALLLKHTTTFGVRKATRSRYVLEREVQPTHTPWGMIGVKKGRGYGLEKEKLEYEDVAALARENGFSIEEMERKIRTYLRESGDAHI